MHVNPTGVNSDSERAPNGLKTREKLNESILRSKVRTVLVGMAKRGKEATSQDEMKTRILHSVHNHLAPLYGVQSCQTPE